MSSTYPRYTLADKKRYLNIMRSFPNKSIPAIMDIIRKEDGKCPDPKTLRRWKKRYLVNNELVDDLGRRQKSFKDVEKSVELKKQNSETNETANQQKDSTKTIDDQNDIIEIPTPLISPEAFSQLHRQLEYLTIIVSANPNLPISALLDLRFNGN